MRWTWGSKCKAGKGAPDTDTLGRWRIDKRARFSETRTLTDN